MSRYYDKDCNPIDMDTWARQFGDMDYRRVLQEDVDVPGSEHSVQVSTVFLGLDHRFGGGGPPILFETMIFGGEYDGYLARYCTEDEARVGHENVAEALRQGRPVKDEGVLY